MSRSKDKHYAVPITKMVDKAVYGSVCGVFLFTSDLSDRFAQLPDQVTCKSCRASHVYQDALRVFYETHKRGIIDNLEPKRMILLHEN